MKRPKTSKRSKKRSVKAKNERKSGQTKLSRKQISELYLKYDLEMIKLSTTIVLLNYAINRYQKDIKLAEHIPGFLEAFTHARKIGSN